MLCLCGRECWVVMTQVRDWLAVHSSRWERVGDAGGLRKVTCVGCASLGELW